MVGVLGFALLLATAGVGWSQFEGNPSIGILELDHPGGLMKLWVEAPVTLSWTEGEGDAATTVYWQRPASRFALGTGPLSPTGGDPTEIGDENYRICSTTSTSGYGLYKFSSQIYFSVDNTNALIEGKYVELRTLMGEAETQSSEAAMANYWPSPLTLGTRDITGTARFAVNRLTTSAAQVRPQEEEELGYLEVEHRYALIHDALMIELTVKNTDTVTHYVGTRVLYDTQFGTTDYYDGQPIFLPDGTIITSERVLPDAQHGLPESWVCYDDPALSPVSIKGIVDTAEVRNSSGGLPDQVEFGIRSRLAAAWFDFTPNPSTSLLNADWGYAVKWDEERLLPGQSRTCVSYIALGAASADYDPSVSAAAYGPRQLMKQEGDDPATDPVEDAEHLYLSDEKGRSPFPVSFFVDNFGASTIFNAQAAIDLPEGLELWPDSQSMVKTIGMVAPNQLKGVTWQVRAHNVRPGIAEIKFSGLGKLIRRKVFVPALPILPPRGFPTGLEMLSVPYTFANTDAQHVFDSLGNLTGGGANDPRLIRYEPGAHTYRQFPHSFLTNVVPGEGYWVYNPTAQTLNLPADAEEVSSDDAYVVFLEEGWNQIGSPFGLPIQFNTAQVLRTGPQDLWTVEEAIARNLFQPALFWYTGQANDPYDWETDVNAIRLDPFEGYWLKTYEEIAFIFPPPSLVMPTAAPEPAVADPDGWRLELTVAGASRLCRRRTLGVSAVAKDGLDQTDVSGPPAALTDGPMLRAEFVSTTQQTPPFVVDMRPANLTEYTWSLAITTDAQNEPITISWPALNMLPSDMIAILEDTVSGQKRFMRTSNSYTYNSGEGGARLVKITIEPANRATPVVSDVTAAAAAGSNWEISYTLSSAASVQARVRNISGVTIKQLSNDEVCSAGRNVMLWNGRSDRGTPVPSGRYLVEIEARSPESGQSSRVIGTLAVMR